MRTLRALLFISSLALGACASVKTQVVPLGPIQHYPPTQSVEVFLQKPSRPYTEIAFVESHGDLGASEADLLNHARDKARALGADAIVKLETQRIYHQPVAVYDPWYDPLFYGYYRYRPFPPFPHPWASPYRMVGGGYSFVLKTLAIKFRDTG
jgi:hypothetical protein